MITKTESQISQQSVDSSQVLSINRSFQSTQSLQQQPINKENCVFQASHTNIQGQNCDKFTQSYKKEVVRFEGSKRQSDVFGRVQQWQGMGEFVGFVGLGKAKNKKIQISQSKLKKATHFMELNQFGDRDVCRIGEGKMVQQYEEQEDSLSTLSLSKSQILQKDQEKTKQQFKFAQFSMGFKSMGTGAMVKVSQQTTNKVKQFFNDFSQYQSYQKLTKSKIIKKAKEQQIQTSQNFINFAKTQKIKPAIKQSKIKIKQSGFKFGINKFEKNKNSNENKQNPFQNIEQITRMNQNYKTVKLQDLPEPSKAHQKQFAQYWTNSLTTTTPPLYSSSTTQNHKQIPQYTFKFQHSCNTCQIKWCYFCQRYNKQQITIDKQFIISQITNIINLQMSTVQRIPKIMQIVIFKLQRYQFFNKQIKNKQFTPNNLLLELYKKCVFYQKQKRGPLQTHLSAIVTSKGKNLGKHINVLILNIAYTKKIDMYFLQVSDGWSCMYIVISSDNQLYKYVQNKRIIIGSKIQITNWNIHSICNIGEYHPYERISKNSQKYSFVEITYNNCRPSGYFSKLGLCKQVFYRSFDKCKAKESAGCVPILQGTVIRMFVVKNYKNVAVNYVEIMLREGGCVLMKVALAQQISLVELFRLYYSYHFLRVKKCSDFLAQFTGNSRYYEINDQQRMERVVGLLKGRLFNLNIGALLASQGQQDMGEERNGIIVNMNKEKDKKVYVDIITKSQQMKIGYTKLIIDEKIDGLVLLQQYLVANQLGDGITLRKGDRGSCLRKIPKIYQRFQYNIL